MIDVSGTMFRLVNCMHLIAHLNGEAKHNVKLFKIMKATETEQEKKMKQCSPSSIQMDLKNL